LEDAEAEEAFQQLTSVVQAVRKIRAEQGIEAGKGISVIIYTKKWMELLESQKVHIERLSRCHVTLSPSKGDMTTEVASEFLPEIEVHVSLEGLIDVEAERKKLQQEAENLKRILAATEGKLANADFVARAPEKVVAAEKEKMQVSNEKLRKIEERLKMLG
jgi:valyl-tRNA synthetase